MSTDPAGKDATAPPRPRWPKVIGTIGAVLGAIMLVDKADDLLLIPMMWSGDGRSMLFGPQWSELLARSMPRGVWLFFYILLGAGLGLLLVVGSLRLRNRYPSGAVLCRAWAWLSIAWLATGLAIALWWLASYRDEIARFAEPGWQQTMVTGTLAAVPLLLAYPVFLIVWLSRAAVKAEIQTWQE